MTARLPLRLTALALVALVVLGMSRTWSDEDPGGCATRGDHR